MNPFSRMMMIGAGVIGSMAMAQAASATATFNFTAINDSAVSSAPSYDYLHYSQGSGSTALTLDVYGAHLSNYVNSSGQNTLGSAPTTVATYQNYGLAVLYGNDTTSNGTHQIDNVGGDGVDFVVFSFNQDVTLNNVFRTAYDGYDGDASFMAYSGSLSSILSGVDESKFNNSLSYTSSTNYVSATNSTASSKIWLVAANVGLSDRNDGFKITDIKVSTSPTSAVPEPASWAMMIVGFGAVGTGMRRRKTGTPALTAA